MQEGWVVKERKIIGKNNIHILEQIFKLNMIKLSCILREIDLSILWPRFKKFDSSPWRTGSKEFTLQFNLKLKI